MAKKHNCERCPIRAQYDKNPRSLIGRFWRWHINFCPGWKGFIKSIEPAQRAILIEKYDLKE